MFTQEHQIFKNSVVQHRKRSPFGLDARQSNVNERSQSRSFDLNARQFISTSVQTSLTFHFNERSKSARQSMSTSVHSALDDSFQRAFKNRSSIHERPNIARQFISTSIQKRAFRHRSAIDVYERSRSWPFGLQFVQPFGFKHSTTHVYKRSKQSAVRLPFAFNHSVSHVTRPLDNLCVERSNSPHDQPLGLYCSVILDLNHKHAPQHSFPQTYKSYSYHVHKTVNSDLGGMLCSKNDYRAMTGLALVVALRNLGTTALALPPGETFMKLGHYRPMELYETWALPPDGTFMKLGHYRPMEL
ncbi:hypothetical protein VIGAN_03226200 [Vigna angularis var. angularis]|uniref:Uncharacterized protein n=1 Tax=Vigna angularis var. angularis TaxID=157739 RepID=A0A0S3RNU3_PHAAN|nr:hypothetical protein VIGAN_03226200 [Vigna angularis var. angularis]